MKLLAGNAETKTLLFLLDVKEEAPGAAESYFIPMRYQPSGEVDRRR